MTMRHSALLALRSPPRLSRLRLVRPEEASIGATPHRWAKAASLRRRPGLSPAETSRAARCVRSHTVGTHQLRGGGGDQRLQHSVEPLALRLEALHASCQFTQREPGGSRRGRRGRPDGAGRSPHELWRGVAPQRLTEVVGAADEQRAHLVDGGDAAVSRRATSHAQGADRFHSTVASLRFPGRLARLSSAGGSDGVHWVGLSVAASQLAVGADSPPTTTTPSACRKRVSPAP